MASENNPTIQNDTLSNQLPNSYLLPVPPTASDEDSADRENTDRENTGRWTSQEHLLFLDLCIILIILHYFVPPCKHVLVLFFFYHNLWPFVLHILKSSLSHDLI